MAGEKGVKLRRGQSRHHDDLGTGIPNAECPYATEVLCDEKKPRSLPFSRWNLKTYMRSGPNAVAFWLCVTLGAIVIFAEDPSTFQETIINNNYGRRIDTKGPERITFKKVHRQAKHISLRHNLERIPRAAFGDPDYGHLNFKSIPSEDEGPQFEQFRSKFLRDIDAPRLSSYYSPHEDTEDEAPACRLPSWTGYTFPSCNQVHELTIERVFDYGISQDFNVSYLNSGTYRDAWRFRRNGMDHLVLKRLMLVQKHNWNSKDMYNIRKEANILERLSPSPRVLDIYGTCGTTVLVEAMASDLHTKIISGRGFASQQELDKLDDVYPLNDFTASEKLQISLDMAESLADLHGFEGGPIIHADTHIEQWLIAPDGSIKLNDFNNAREPPWDQRKGEYCPSRSTYGGVYRSPQEFSGASHDESVDTFAYANNIYTLLTGLWPFYDDQYKKVSGERIRRWLIAGRRPFVDPRYRERSYIEHKLVEIMERCWVHRSKERPSIFEVVDFLREVKLKATKKGELQPSKRIKITKNVL